MKVSLASQALAVEECRDRSALLARDKGMSRDASTLFKQHVNAAAETIRWLQANEADVRAFIAERRARA